MEIKNLYTFYKYYCQKYANNMLFTDLNLTYTQVLSKVLAKAAFLQKAGYKKGDVIAILASNSPEWLMTFMAITSMGAISLNLDINLKPEIYQQMLDHVQTKAIFISPEFKMTFTKQKTLDISFEKEIEPVANFKEPDTKEDDISNLLFTSGTTGKPKVVALTQANWYKTAISGVKHLQLRADFVVLCILPLYHVYGLIGNFMGEFAAGCSLIFQPSLKGPDILKSLAEHPIKMFPVVPQLLELFLDGILNKAKAQSLFKYKLLNFFLNNTQIFNHLGLGFIPRTIFKPIHKVFGPNLDYFICGGAPLKAGIYHAYKNMGFTVVNGYGLTETSGPVAGTTPLKTKPCSIGKPMEGNEIKIKNINDDGVGEIWIRGVSVTPGYYNNPEANKEAFDSDGWFNSGDHGYLDKEGDIILTGRLKNVIVLDSGKNVYPEELEAYYIQSPLIQDLAIFSRNINNKDIVYAVIVPATKNKNSYQEIKAEITRLNEGLPSYKIINQFAISFDPLPKTSTKKTIIREVVALHEKGAYQTDENKSAATQKMIVATGPEEEEILNVVLSKLGQEHLYELQTLADLNIDSLRFIDFVVTLEEKLGITIDSQQLAKTNNIKEMLAFLKNCPQSINQQIFESKINTHTFFMFNPLLELFLLLVKLVSKICWKLRIINPELLTINNNIICANHQSYLDIMWLLTLIPYSSRRHICMIGKKQLSFFKYMFPGIPMLFVEREGNFLPTLKASADLLRQGKTLIIFPEGTRTMDGYVGEFKTGAAYLAKNLNKTIIPITIKGGYEIYPRQKKLPSFIGKFEGRIFINQHIDPSKYKSVDELNLAIQQTIKNSFAIL
jgi:long-chain acyl-CoA synthetase